jgi:hypothetical protein
MEETGWSTLVPQNEDQYEAIEAKERDWNTVFVVLYVLGAAILGWSFIKDELAMSPGNNA